MAGRTGGLLSRRAVASFSGTKCPFRGGMGHLPERAERGMVGRIGGIVNAVEDADELVGVELTEMERRMLFIGLFDWGGPAYCGDSLAQALGFRDVQNLYDDGHPLAEAIARGEPQSRRDWSRALASLEVMLGSSVLGSGEWGAVHGYDEADLFVALQALRRKLPTSRGYLRR